MQGRAGERRRADEQYRGHCGGDARPLAGQPAAPGLDGFIGRRAHLGLIRIRINVRLRGSLGLVGGFNFCCGRGAFVVLRSLVPGYVVGQTTRSKLLIFH